MSAPTRLLEDTTIPQKMRDDLRRTQGAVILPFDTAAGLARFQAGLNVGGTIAPAAAGSLWGGAAWKGLAALGVAGGIAWVLLSGSSDGESGRERTSVQETVPELPAEPQTVPRERESGVEATAGDSSPVEIEKSSRDVAPVKAPHTPPAVSAPRAPQETSDPLADEIAHLESLRKLHQQDPNAAIAAAKQGHRDFTAGILYEEREALLILSLQRVGRGAEAGQRIEAFRERFPKSAFLSKMGARSSSQQAGEVKPAP